jgi:hypothetical protein
LHLLLGGRPVAAAEAVGWLVDFAGPMDDVLVAAWKLASGKDTGVKRRPFEAGALMDVPSDVAGLPPAGSQATEVARKAIVDTVRASCGASVADALAIQATHSARFMTSDACTRGVVGAEFSKTMRV